MNPLDEVMTATEAAVQWGIAVRTIQQACTGYRGGPARFHPDEVRKAIGVWLVTRTGMERLYDPRPEESKE